MTTCERLDIILKERGISRRKLALAAGISPSSFQTAMSRNTTISYDMLIPISKVLQVPVYELMGYSLKHDTPENRAIAEAGVSAAIETIAAMEKHGFTEVSFEQVYAEQQAFLENRMKKAFSALNETGQTVACERVEELAEIKKFRRTGAEHSGGGIVSPPDDKKPPEGQETPPDGNK